MSLVTDRRKFLQTTAVTGLGYWVAGGVEAAVSKSPNDQIQLGCIGVGGKGQSDVANVAKYGKIYALCDVDTSIREGMEKAYKTEHNFTDYREMLDKLGDRIDAVTISVPDHNHAVMAAKAMKMGKHVHCQKPLTHSIWEARRLSEIAREAGRAILDVYGRDDFAVSRKSDNSPLTEADQVAHGIISRALAKLDATLPILSEESAPADHAERRQWQRYWLVDPLDGTKEFLKRNGEFTVNIALIDEHRAVLGAVYAPVLDRMYFGHVALGAWRSDAAGAPKPIAVRDAGSPLRVVGSRSHPTPELAAYRRELTNAITQVSAAVDASGFHSELWSYELRNGRVVPVRYGSGSDVQLWSTTDLSVGYARRNRR